MVFICMRWTVFNTSFNGEKCFHLSVLIYSNIYWGPHGHYSSLLVIGSLTLRLHYVPGDHGSHGSPKRSAPCDLVIFCLGTQVLLSIITFRHGLSRYPLQTVGLTPGDTTVRYVKAHGLSRKLVRFLKVCHVLMGPLTFRFFTIKVCHVYQVLSRPSTVSRDRRVRGGKKLYVF